MKRWLALFAVCVAFGVSATGLAPIASAQPSADSSVIQHFVVMTQGGRSFDNYFGARPGVDGIPANSCQLPSKISQPQCVRPFPIKSASQQRALRTTVTQQVQSVDRGRMNGFVRAQTTRESDGTAAIGYFRPQSLPLLTELADRAVLFDHWFSGVPGGTIGNRLFDITARPSGDPLEVPSQGWGRLPVIFDRLTAAGVSWRIYVQNYEPVLTIKTASTKQRLGGQVARVPVLAMNRYIDNPAVSSHIVDLGRYYRDLAAGTLPAVSYIVSTSATEQSPQDPTSGNRLTRAVVNGLLASSAWSHSAFLLQYDSSGGWFDHVQPPRIDGATVGLRVPALLISPYAAPDTVAHGKFDAASALKFIERRWNLAPLASRDRDAGDMTTAFQFARHPKPGSLVGVADDRKIIQPDRVLLYVGYSIVMLAALATGGVVLYVSLRDARRAGWTRTRWV